MKARNVMTSNPEVLVPEDSVGHAASVMKRMDIGALPVVEDRAGMRLVGVVALADIAREVGPQEPGAVVRVLEDISAGEGPDPGAPGLTTAGRA